LVSEHDKEFCFLAGSSALDYPRRDFAGVTGNMPARASKVLALPNARRTYNGKASRAEKENAKHAPQSQRSRDLL
jgi:hypothetical protein